MDVKKWQRDFAELQKSHDIKLAHHLNENVDDQLQCDNCHISIFWIYCTEIIDDARVYCAGCGKQII